MMLETEREILTVSQLNHLAREVLEECFPAIWVEGEISNLSCPSSGHIYFTLKDENAQISCALFRNRKSAKLELTNGMHVIVRAGVSLYENRGNYQLIVEHIEEAGSGKLQKAFEELKAKLAKEGLFDEKYKKAIPSFPKTIGIITSPTGAAIRDILTVLKRRFPSIPIIIYPTQVQGEQAAKQIVAAIEIANTRNECDVLILTRGGGSLEDLWPFNEEIVARAIFACVIPIISAVGHEIDFSISDFVADLRAATPSAAAELVSPDQDGLLQQLERLHHRFFIALQHQIKHLHNQLHHLQKRLRDPATILRENMQKIDYLEERLRLSFNNLLQKKNFEIQHLFSQLQRNNPIQNIFHQNEICDNQLKRLNQAMINLIFRKQQLLSEIARSLDNVSPLATLSRGYAIVTRVSDHNIVRNAKDVKQGERIRTRVAQGEIESIVDGTN